MLTLRMPNVSLLVALLLSSPPIAAADSLTAIPPYPGDNTSTGRAIIGNGIAVGQSSNSASPNAASGIIWDSTNGTRRVISSDGAQASIVTGVGYRDIGGQIQLVLHGLSAGWSTNWFSNDDGLTFANKLRSLNVGTIPRVEAANTLGAIELEQVWYNVWFNTLLGDPLYIERGQGTGDPPDPVIRDVDVKQVTTKARIHSASTTGLCAGRRKDDWSGTYQNYVLQWTGTGTPYSGYLNGLNGTTEGQAWAISGDGNRIFGTSPVNGGRTGTWPYMAVAPFGVTSSPGTAPPSAALYELPTFPTTGGSVTNAVVYRASYDGRYAVGMDYLHIEQAVVWDTVNSTITNLTDYFSSRGLLGNFTYLSRAYGVTVDGAGELWITGNGRYNDGGTVYTRGFVARISNLYPHISRWRSLRSTPFGDRFGITLDADQPPESATIESRDGGLERIELELEPPAQMLWASQSVMVTPGDGSEVIYPPYELSSDGRILSILFYPGMLPDRKCYNISVAFDTVMPNLTGDLDCDVRLLAGDTNQNGVINLGDVLYIRSQDGNLADDTNCPLDVNVDGFIDSLDWAAVKPRITTPPAGVPCP